MSLALKRGDAVAIMGPSGSGKSTLLHMLGDLDPPTSGRLRSTAPTPYKLGEREQAAFRNQRIGFVFQDHSLLPQCSVLENVLTPTLVAPARNGARRRKALRAMSACPGHPSPGRVERAARSPAR